MPADARVDARLFSAIINLCNQFSACGLEPPVSITVKPGQVKWIEFMVSQSVQMLHDDSRNLERRGGLRVWGVLIGEVDGD